MKDKCKKLFAKADKPLTSCSSVTAFVIALVIVTIIFVVVVISFTKSEQELREDMKAYQQTTHEQIESLQIDVENLKAEIK